MPTMSDIFRKITIQSTAPGASETADALLKIATAQGNVAIATERSEKSVLSMESKLHKLKLSLDEEYRSEEKLAQIEKTLHAARLQGAVSIEEQYRLLGLAKLRYTEAGEAAKVMQERLATAKEAAMGLASGLGAGLVLGGLAELPSKIMEINHEAAGLSHTAEAVGITTAKLQELQYAGLQFHVGTDVMDSALERFSKNLGTAATGAGVLAKILALNHVKISGDVTKDFLNYANLIEHASNAEERNLLVTTAFGKNAEEMGLLFERGAAGIDEATAAAERNGAVLGGPALKAAQDLDKQWVITSATMSTDFKNLAINIAPLLASSIEGVTDSIRMMGFAINQIKSGDLVGGLNTALNPFGSDEKWLETQMRAGTAKMASGLSGEGVNDFYKDIPGIRKPLEVTVPGDHTIIPSTPDAGAKAAEKKIQSVTDALNLQLKTLTETDRQKQIDTELSKAGVEASTKQGKAIEALTGKLYDEKKALADANQAANFLAQSTETAFEGIITGSSSVQDALAGIVKALAQAVIQAELLGSGPLAGILGTSPTTSGGAGGILGSLFSALIPHANGGVYNSPSLSAYSNQVVTKPTLFAFANGGVPNMGVFSEKGSEAIMPLKMGSDGRLGVSASNSNQPSTIVYAPVYNFPANGSAEEIAKLKVQVDADQKNFAVRVQKVMGDKRTR
jgi:hypothetical protein